MIFAEHVKNKLSSLIHKMATAPWLFSKNPEVDFSRNRKLDFVSTIQFLLSMESGSLKKELLDYFQFSVDTPSASAFCQQRNKLLLEAFQFLFYEFNSCFSFEKKYKDYQLLACDGSDLNIARNPNDAGVDQHIIICHFQRNKQCRNNTGIFHPRTPGILVITVIEKIITVITRLKTGCFNFPNSANYGIK